MPAGVCTRACRCSCHDTLAVLAGTRGADGVAFGAGIVRVNDSGVEVAYRHVYVHVPFCARRCSYCDFAIAVRRTVPVREFVAGIAAELRARRIAPGVVDSIYLGGGTPSRLGGAGIRELLDTVRSLHAPAEMAEITIEVNPEDVTAQHALEWAHSGITRVSLGVQSFHDAVLQWMHRVHDARAVPDAMAMLRDAGLTDVSVDLIFSVPSALRRDWSRDIDQALALDPTHVSLYGLTVEPGTPLGRWTARGEAQEAPEEHYEAEFLLAHERFAAAGFRHYEVSNYARPGHVARHNSAYWRSVPYLGIGPSAHGFDGIERRWNVAPYADWQRRVDTGEDPVDGREQLTDANRTAEDVYLGLRTDAGLPLRDGDARIVRQWEDAGWVTLGQDGVLRCTASGWLRLDALAAALTAGRSP
jgi:oxygen-independent coproporphyrinogen III oxidase